MTTRQQLISRKVDVRTEYLVFGYVRNLNIIHQIIPSSVILLCIKFYLSKLRIINLQTNPEIASEAPLFTVAVLEENKSYQCVMRSKLPSTKTHKIYNQGIVYVKDIELPKNALSISSSLSKNAVYDVVFVIGQMTSNAYIIDTSQFAIANHKIDVYHWHLPTTPGLNGNGQRSIYSRKRKLLLQIGGFHDKIINGLSFISSDLLDIKKWKWNELTQMDHARAHVAISFMDNDNKLFACSGYNSGGGINGYLDTAQIYDINDDKWIKIASMKQRRCRAGIYIDKYLNNRVYVGGGKVASTAGTKKFEYYDHVQNEWFLLKETNNFHGRAPIMWKDGVNVIYIGSTYGSSIERMDLRENKWTISLASKLFENLFGSKSTDYTQLCLDLNDLRDYL